MNNNFQASNNFDLKIDERLYYALLEYMDIIEILEFFRQPDLTVEDIEEKLKNLKEEKAQRVQSPYVKRIVTDRLDPEKGKIYKRSY